MANLQQRWSAAAITYHPKDAGDGLSVVQRVFHDDDHTNALVLQSIFAINRYEMAPEIARLLAAGRHVVLDRYWPSGVVYGSCDGLDAKWLTLIHERLPQPDIWFLLDVPPGESVVRRPDRRDRYERDENMGKRRDIYRQLFEERARAGENWHILDGVGTVDEVHARILGKLDAPLRI